MRMAYKIFMESYNRKQMHTATLQNILKLKDKDLLGLDDYNSNLRNELDR